MWMRGLAVCLALASMAAAQDQAPAAGNLKPRDEITPPAQTYRVETGTRILMTMINSVSTKHAQPGDKIYLRTSFPVTVNGKIVIPEGSYVTGVITSSKRAGRVKGRAQLAVNFDSIMLPNGTARVFKSDLAAIDGTSDQRVDSEHSTIKGDSGKGQDAATIAKTTAAGAGLGTVIGSSSGRWAKGLGIGAAAGAAAGLITVLATRGPDATLEKGSTVELVTDRPIEFNEAELANTGANGGVTNALGNFQSPNRAQAVDLRRQPDVQAPQPDSQGGFKRAPQQ